MEQPDEHGYVNVTWPSKTVPHGGIFHTKIPEPSTEQQNFLKVLLEESKLSVAQRRKSAFKLRENEVKEETRRIQVQSPLVRPRTSKRRSLSSIRESGAFDADTYKFRPLKRGEDREMLKDRLANTMAFGDEGQKPPPPPPRLLKPPPQLPTKKEQWNDLLTQIRERAEWLAEMEDLGHAGPHRDMVKDQIAERLRALDALGIDECSTARSSASGFSVLTTGHQSVRPDRRSACSVQSSASSNGSTKQKLPMSKRRPKEEENVAAYNKMTPLHYSPRRRV